MTKKVLLQGGFSGWLNFGDIVQLLSWLSFYKERGYIPYVLLSDASLQSPFHIELLKKLFGNGMLFYGYNEEKKDITFQPLEEVEIYHLYGGGFFNRFWGSHVIEVLEKALSFFKPKRYFITGQQISEEFVPYFVRHVSAFNPEVVAVRDKTSFDLLKREGVEVEISSDDSIEFFLKIKTEVEKKQFSTSRSGKTLFLHLNLSYYTLNDEGEAFKLKPMLESLLESAEKVYFIKAFQSYGIEVKETFRAVDYLYLTEKVPAGTFLDLTSLLFSKDFSPLAKALKEAEEPLLLSNSYHTALFFAFLSVPVYLFSFNPYYRQKGYSFIPSDIPIEELWKKREELKNFQKNAVKEMLKVREVFMEKFENILKNEGGIERDWERTSFTYLSAKELEMSPEARVEIDPYVKMLNKRRIEEREWLQNQAERLKNQVERLKNQVERLENQAERLKNQVERLKKEEEELRFKIQAKEEELNRIYRSRGWRLLSIYYRIKHRIYVTLGLVKE